MANNWNDSVEITQVFRVRIDFKHPPKKPASTTDGDDFEFEGDWRNRVSDLMDEIHVVGSDADKLESCEGIDVVGVDPYVVAEFSSIDQARETANSICEMIVGRGGVIVPSDDNLDEDINRITERAAA
jgi:hypothetical protein